MSPTTHSSHIPRLRFPGFFGDWEEKKLGEIGERITKKNKEYNENVLTISGQLGLISQTEFFNKSVAGSDLSGYYLLEKGDFAYNKSYSNGYPMGAIKKLNRYDKGVVSTLYICFKINDKLVNKNLLEQYFESGNHNRKIAKVAQEGARNHGLLNIAVGDFFQTEFNLPPLPEQTKIASFLTAVDDKIQSLSQLRDAWSDYKTGMMQQIFSQTIRCAGFTDEWEERKLGEVATFSKGKGISKEDIVENGNIECIRYGELYTTYQEIIKEIKSKTNIVREKLILSEYNDIVIPASGETQIDIATASCVLKDNVALGGDLNIIKTKNNGVFLSYYLNSTKKKDIARVAQGISVVHLYTSQLKNIKLNLPSLPEQEKIADFLSNIDNKIAELDTQIQTAKQWKKGLLQGLFI